MAEGKKSVLLYCDLIHTVEKMDDALAGRFFKHYLRYINDQNPIAEDLVVDIAFESVKQNLKRDLKKWEVSADRSRNNGKLGGRPKKEETQKTQQVISKPRKPDTVTVTVTDTVNVTDTVKNEVLSVGEKTKRFSPPTIQEVQKYCFERKNNVDSERFIDHYTSNGWMVGKTKMKDWEASVRTWEKSGFKNSNTNGNGKSKQELFNDDAREWIEELRTNGQPHEGVDSGKFDDYSEL